MAGEALAEEATRTRIVPVMHDSSGAAGINFVIDHPKNVASLVILNSAFARAPTDKWPELIELFATTNLKALSGAILQSPAQFGWIVNFQREQFKKSLADKHKARYDAFLGQIIDGNFRNQTLPSLQPATGIFRLASSGRMPVTRSSIRPSPSTKIAIEGNRPTSHSDCGKAMKAATMRATAVRSVGTNTKDPELIRDRREQLIRAALEVFKEKGFHATTVRDIGRAAGLTQGTIYNYVRSKEDILFLVCDRVIAEYISSMEKAAAAIGDPVARLREALRGVAQVMIDRQGSQTFPERLSLS